MQMSGMSDMGGSSGGSQPMSMSMVFTNDHSTPLFSSQWTPTTNAGYGGTCLFLIAFAIISRLLLAYRSSLEDKWRHRAVSRRYAAIAAATDASRRGNSARREDVSDKGEGLLDAVDARGESTPALRTANVSGRTAAWRLSVDLPRACIFTVQAGVGYLLMLAVMTLNIGYFLSVLTGLFLGELAVGRYAHMEDGHH